MAFLLNLLLLAPAPAADRVPEVVNLVKARETTRALALLKEIGTHKKNHDEARSLVKMIRSGLRKPPEVVEAAFLALKGIGSRKATRGLLALLRHSRLKKDPAVRIGVCRALGGSADPAAVEAIVDRLRDVDDHVIAAAAEACGAYRYAKEPLRKDLFRKLLDTYVPTFNLKNSVQPELKVVRARAERKWELIEKPAEKSMQLLSNVTQSSPKAWRRWWNKNKKKRWAELEN